MAKIIAVANGKGGVGKTTTALALAGILSDKYRVLGVDADPQKSFTKIANRFESVYGDGEGFDIATETNPDLLAKLRKIDQYDIVIVDTQPAILTKAFQTVAKNSDLVVMPCQQGFLDFESLVDTLREIIVPQKVGHLIVLTRVKSQQKAQAKQVIAFLKERGANPADFVIREYAAHSAAMLHSTPIDRYKGKNANLAASDYKKLAQSCIDILEI